jgi:hypothetical protein
MRRLRLLVSVCVVSALALGASLAEAVPPPSLPDGPDLSAMAVTAADFGQATVVAEGYTTGQGVLSAYERTFSFPSGGRLLAAATSVSLFATGSQAQAELAAVRRALRTRRSRAAFARSFASGFARGSGLRATRVTASRATSLGIGVDSLRIGVAFQTRVGRFHAVFALVRVDRAVSVLILLSPPGRTVRAADVVRVGRVQRDRFRTGFTVSSSAIPVVSGLGLQGQTLSADRGRWNGGPTEYAYQWSRCDGAGVCTPIAGAVSATYVVGQQDVGSSLKVTVTARNPVSSAPADSNLTYVVA